MHLGLVNLTVSVILNGSSSIYFIIIIKFCIFCTFVAIDITFIHPNENGVMLQ